MTVNFDPANTLLQDAKTGTIPTSNAEIILEDIIGNSSVMQVAKYQDMKNKPKTQFTFLAKGPGAYWVKEGEKIQTSKIEWKQAEMEAQKLGVIIPFSKEFLKYSVQDFLTQAQPLIAEAFYTAFDKAVLFGDNSPWGAGKSIVEHATKLQHVVQEGTGANIYEDIVSSMALVENTEHDPNGFLTSKSFKSKLRTAIDKNGNPIFDVNAQDVVGMPATYIPGKAFNKEKAIALLGDWDYAYFGILQDIEYSISEEAQLSTIEVDGEPLNLWERDVFALKATMHIAYLNVKPDAFSIITKQ